MHDGGLGSLAHLGVTLETHCRRWITQELLGLIAVTFVAFQAVVRGRFVGGVWTQLLLHVVVASDADCHTLTHEQSRLPRRMR